MSAVVKPLSHTLDEFRYNMEESVHNGEHEKIEPPVEHFHTPDLYGRRIFVPGGTAIVTKVHKTEHITLARLSALPLQYLFVLMLLHLSV